MWELFTENYFLLKFKCENFQWNFHGIIRPGVLGNKHVYLTSSIPKMSITTLSRPRPAPPCGGQPYLKASM